MSWDVSIRTRRLLSSRWFLLFAAVLSIQCTHSHSTPVEFYSRRESRMSDYFTKQKRRLALVPSSRRMNVTYIRYLLWAFVQQIMTVRSLRLLLPESSLTLRPWRECQELFAKRRASRLHMTLAPWYITRSLSVAFFSMSLIITCMFFTKLLKVFKVNYLSKFCTVLS